MLRSISSDFAFFRLAGAGLGGAGAGFAAGWLGQWLLGRLRRGVRVRRSCCEVPIAAMWALVAMRLACGGLPGWWLPVPLSFGWFAVLLGVCDLRARRLPNALVMPAHLTLATSLLVSGRHVPDLVGRAVLGAVGVATCYALVHWVAPSAMGAGDVKLAGAVGAAVASVSSSALLVWTGLATVATLLSAVVPPGWRATVPHGPAMLLPAWLITALLVPGPPGKPAGLGLVGGSQMCCVG